MIYDFIQLIPEINIKGIDISEYAITNAKPEIKDKLTKMLKREKRIDLYEKWEVSIEKLSVA